MSPATVPAEGHTHLSVKSSIQHMCPFKNEVDCGTITVAWQVDGHTLELHSLREYFHSFIDREISHEELTDEIRAELSTHHGITDVTVSTRWHTAGMEVECSTSPTPAGRQ